jgi:hypothetical protein
MFEKSGYIDKQGDRRIKVKGNSKSITEEGHG